MIQRSLDFAQAMAARSVDQLSPSIHQWLNQYVFNNPLTYEHLDPSIQTIMNVRKLRGGKGTVEGDPLDSRQRFKKEMAKIVLKPTEVASICHWTIPGEASPLRARQYIPFAYNSQGNPNPTSAMLVFFHGGGFIVGDIDTHDELCRMLCHHGGFHVLSVNYRLSPEHAFPAAFNDGVAALRWAKANATALGVHAKLIGVCGDSAGGGLATAAALSVIGAGGSVAAQILLYPAVDYHILTDSKLKYADGLPLTYTDLVAAYARYNPLNLYSATDPRLAPLYSPSVPHAPLTRIYTAELDILRDEAEIYAKRLQAHGVDVRLKRFASLPHGFASMTSINRRCRAATVQIAQESGYILGRLTKTLL